MPDIEYLICTFVDEHNQDEVFVEWPLHITLVTWFSDSAIWDLQVRLIEVSSQIHPLSVTVGQDNVWGSNTVNVIEPTTEIFNLHRLLLHAVKVSGQIVTNEQYMGENYTPHVTQQRTQRAHPGEEIRIDAVYIVEKNKGVKIKTILYKLWLS